MPAQGTHELVEGRDCGGCTVCCSLLPIDTPELCKVPGVPCVQLKAHGCGIYETRFPICRTYHCGWRKLAMLDESWRPDLSGVLVSPHGDARMAGADGIEFLVFGGAAALRRPAFVPLVLSLIADGVSAYLAIPGPPAHFSARVLLNPVLGEAAVARDNTAALRVLMGALKAAKTHKFERMGA